MKSIFARCGSIVGQLNRSSWQLALRCNFCDYESSIIPEFKQHLHESHAADLQLNDQECLIISELLKSQDLLAGAGEDENMPKEDAELDGSVVMDGSVVKDDGTNDENVAKEDDKNVDN